MSMQTLAFTAVIATVATVLASAPAMALDVHGFSVEAAKGRDASMLRLGVQRNMERTWLRSGNYHLGAFWDLTLAGWRGHAHQDRAGDRQDLWDLGLTPTFRYQRHDKRGWYAEGAIGVHYLSGKWDNGGKTLSTRFQFGDHLGAGYVFPNGVDLALKVQHYSNGGLRRPNDGANFLVFKAGFPF